MNKTPSLKSYIDEVVQRLSALQGLASQRRQTTKVKAAGTCLTLLRGRANGTKEILASGGPDVAVQVANVSIQQSVYDPCIEFFASLLEEKES